VVGDGLLLRNGEQVERGIFGTTLRPEVEAHVRAYVPLSSPWRELWPVIQAFVVRIALAVRPPSVNSARSTTVAVTRLAGWAVGEGVALEEEVLFRPLRIEQFTAWPGAGSEGLRANMRSRLRAIGREVTRDAPWPPEPTRLRRRELAVPYMPFEIDLLREDIERQFKVTRRAAEVVHNLCLGAGLRPKAVRQVTAAHVVQIHGTWCVATQHGEVVHHIPIRLPYVPVILDLADRYPAGPLAHRNAHRMDVSVMLERFRPGPCTPVPNTWRYRSTWLLSHLALGTRIDLIIEAAGVRDQRGIMDLLQYLPPVEAPVAMRMLVGPAS